MSTAVADYEQEIDGEVVEIQDAGTALMALNKSEIDIQIATAKQYPRSIKQFKADALDMATLDEETAASMFYSLPRAGNRIEGPSVRLAEVVGSSFGNLRYSARIVEIGDSFVTAQGMCFDLQKNIAASVEAKRRITDKRGRRFNDDMIQVTCNAACSIALRGAIFKVVPFAFVKPIFEQAKLTAIGKAESVIDRRNKAVAWFKKLGATEQQLLDMLGRKGWDDVTTDDLVSLRGLATAIKDGETTIEDALRPKDHGGPRAGVSALNDKLAPKNPPDEQAVKHESAPAA